jgi:hypothetical protein
MTEATDQKKKLSFKKSCLFLIVAFFGLSFVIVLIMGDEPKQTSENKVPSIESTDSVSNKAATLEPEIQSDWLYEAVYNEMDDKTTYYAQLKSTNNLNFQFPYNGGSPMYLNVRKKGKSIKVYLQIKPGQFLIDSYNNKTIRIKYDDGKSSAYTALTAADGSSDVIFIQNTARFMTNLKRSKKLLIEAPYYQEGAQLSRFNVEHLDLAKLSGN